MTVKDIIEHIIKDPVEFIIKGTPGPAILDNLLGGDGANLRGGDNALLRGGDQ